MSCSIQSCQGKVYARGWCRKHYRHVVEGGHAEPLPVPPSNCKCGQAISTKATSSGLCRNCYYPEWKDLNKQDQDTYHKEYRVKNKEKISQQVKNWRSKNWQSQNAWYAERRKDPQYRIAHNLRSRLYDILAGRIKHKSTEDLTGCSFEALSKHLESQFKPEMSWDNYGSYWVIDHIIPLISIDVTNPIELERVCHFSNLRPLEYIINSSKATQDKLWKKK